MDRKLWAFALVVKFTTGISPVTIMTDQELFETGEGVIAEGQHPPFTPAGVAMILELHYLFPKNGEDSLRANMRTFFEVTLTNKEGLTREIGRIIGNGKPIDFRILKQAEGYRSLVRNHLKTVVRRLSEQLTENEGDDE